MFNTFGARDGPCLADHAMALVEGLQHLRLRFQDAVARLVGGSVAGAVAGLLRRLLGWPQQTREDEEGHPQRSSGWGGDDGQFQDEAEEGLLGGWPMPLAPAGLLWRWLSGLAAWLMALVG
jgi:hypothetical protein